MSTAHSGEAAADVMLRDPKTLPADATVADVREVLANSHVQMVLLADGPTFAGAVTSVPDDVPGGAAAAAFADLSPETIHPDEPASAGFAKATKSPHRRVVVLDDDGALLGLLCLDKTKTHWCTSH